MNQAVNKSGAPVSGTIRSGKFDLSYRIEGQGPTALVIGSSVFYPRTFSEKLRANLKLVFVDHRGFARATEKVERADFDLDVILSDIELVRETLKLGEVIIVGHSGHGYMALEYAKRYPNSVSRVVVIATGPSHGVHMELAQRNWDESVCPERKQRFEQDMALLNEDIQSSPENRFVHFCIRMAAKSWFDLSFDPTYLWKGVHSNVEMFDYVFGETFRDIDVAKDLERIDKPVFLAMGRIDYQVAPHWAWDPYRPKFRNLTFKVFDQSAHTPQLEESENFDSELLKWMNR